MSSPKQKTSRTGMSRQSLVSTKSKTSKSVESIAKTRSSSHRGSTIGSKVSRHRRKSSASKKGESASLKPKEDTIVPEKSPSEKGESTSLKLKEDAVVPEEPPSDSGSRKFNPSDNKTKLKRKMKMIIIVSTLVFLLVVGGGVSATLFLRPGGGGEAERNGNNSDRVGSEEDTSGGSEAGRNGDNSDRGRNEETSTASEAGQNGDNSDRGSNEDTSGVSESWQNGDSSDRQSCEDDITLPVKFTLDIGYAQLVADLPTMGTFNGMPASLDVLATLFARTINSWLYDYYNIDIAMPDTYDHGGVQARIEEDMNSGQTVLMTNITVRGSSFASVSATEFSIASAVIYKWQAFAFANDHYDVYDFGIQSFAFTATTGTVLTPVSITFGTPPFDDQCYFYEVNGLCGEHGNCVMGTVDAHCVCDIDYAGEFCAEDTAT